MLSCAVIYPDREVAYLRAVAGYWTLPLQPLSREGRISQQQPQVVILPGMRCL